MPLDPKDWIDPQRAAGDKRGNIFNDILAACAARRAGRVAPGELRTERRVERVEQMRGEGVRRYVSPELVAYQRDE